MSSLRIEWDMYGVPIMLTVAMMLFLVVGNIFLERAFKKNPKLRPRIYFILNSLGYAYFGTMVLAIFMGATHAAMFYPLLLVVALLVSRKKSRTGSPN